MFSTGRWPVALFTMVGWPSSSTVVRRLLLGLPVLDDPFSVGEVCDNRQTELMERGVIAAQRIHECPRIVSCPRRIESDKQCGVHATCLVVGWIPYVSPEALLAAFRAKFRQAYLP